MDLIHLYKPILESANAISDEAGALSFHFDGAGKPITVGEKRLCLPTREVLSNSDFSKVIVFHPLSEDIMKGESSVLQKTRNLFLLRLTTSIKLLAISLMNIAGDTTKHRNLSPEQQKLLLTPLSKADTSTAEQLQALMMRCSPTKANRLISLYLKRGGKIKGTGFARAGIVTFPVIEALDAADRKVFGELLKVNNVKMIKALFELIVPKATDVESYSFGSNSKVAPFFHALLGAYINVAYQVNTVADQFKDQLEAYDDIHIPLEWSDLADDLTPFNNLLDPMEGNLGAVVDTATKSPGSPLNVINANDINSALSDGPVKSEQAPFTETAKPVVGSPLALGSTAPKVPAPAATTQSGEKKLDWAAMVNQRFQNQQQQMQQQQMMPVGYPTPGLQFQQPAQYNGGYGAMGGSTNHIRGTTPGWPQYPTTQPNYVQPGYSQPVQPMMNTVYTSI